MASLNQPAIEVDTIGRTPAQPSPIVTDIVHLAGDRWPADLVRTAKGCLLAAATGLPADVVTGLSVLWGQQHGT